jgi:hypothetical protein
MGYRDRLHQWTNVSLPAHREERILAKLREAAQEPHSNSTNLARRRRRGSVMTWGAAVGTAVLLWCFGMPEIRNLSDSLVSGVIAHHQYPVFVPPTGMWRAFQISSDDETLTAIGYSDTKDGALRGQATDVFVVAGGQLVYQYKASRGEPTMPTWLNQNGHYCLLIPNEPTQGSLTQSYVHVVDIVKSTSWNVREPISDLAFQGLSLHKYSAAEVLVQGRLLGGSTPTWYTLQGEHLQVIPVNQTASSAQNVHFLEIHVESGSDGKGGALSLKAPQGTIHLRIGDELAVVTDNPSIPLEVVPGSGDGAGILLPSPYKDGQLFRFNQPYSGHITIHMATRPSGFVASGSDSISVPIVVSP